MRRFVVLVVLAVLGLPAGGRRDARRAACPPDPDHLGAGALRAGIDSCRARRGGRLHAERLVRQDLGHGRRHSVAPRTGLQTNLQPAAIAQSAQSAAQAAGYDLARYTTVGIAMAHLDACPWGGAYFPPGIWLNGRHDRHVIAHELGHTYGVSEKARRGSATRAAMPSRT